MMSVKKCYKIDKGDQCDHNYKIDKSDKFDKSGKCHKT